MISIYEGIVLGVLFIILLTAGPKAVRKWAWHLGRAQKIYRQSRKKPLTEEELKEFEEEEEE